MEITQVDGRQSFRLVFRKVSLKREEEEEEISQREYLLKKRSLLFGVGLTRRSKKKDKKKGRFPVEEEKERNKVSLKLIEIQYSSRNFCPFVRRALFRRNL